MFRRTFLMFSLFLAACAGKPRRITAPIEQLWLLNGQRQSKNLIVFLPGIADFPQDFSTQGFAQAVRDRRIDADMVAVDAHWGYYQTHLVTKRLKEDVIEPARAKGYTKFWLVGISLGGWGALQYVRRYENEIDGMLLLAPYIGDKKLFEEVHSAGGLDAWRPNLSDPMDEQRLVMAWLRDFQQPQSSLKFCLSYGASDRFAKPLGWYAARLPQQQVDVVPGGHDWRTWRQLWQRFLQRGELSRDA